MGPNSQGTEELVGQIIAGYRLEAVLGEGATGAVYLGRRLETTPHLFERTGLAPLELPDEAAIKLLLPPVRLSATMQAELRRRFLREAAILQRLRHPHIVPVLRFDEDEASGHLYMVLPVLHGTLIELAVQQTIPLAGERIAGILDDVAAALDYAHGKRVVHRDIKLGNILLDDQGHACLTDFGIARMLAEATMQLTATHQIVGTPEYMAPEQARGQGVTGAADIYSLGVVLYRLVTGQLPFRADSPVGLGMLHVTEPPPSPRALRPDLPAPAEAVILKALAKQPGQRFATAAAFAQAFRAGLAGQWTPGLTTYVAPAVAPTSGPTLPAQGDIITVQQSLPPPPTHKWRLPIVVGSLLLLSTLLVTGTLAAAAKLGIGLHSTSTPTQVTLGTHTPFPPTITVGPGTPTPTPRSGQPTPTLAPGQPIPPSTPPGQPTPVPATNPTATSGPPVAIYGDGSDGPLTVSSNIVDAPLDASCTGSAGSISLSFANASGPFAFLNGKPILIHQSQGSNAGTWMRNTIASAPGTTSGTLSLASPLNATYSGGCQVIVLHQYTNVTVSAGATWSANPWDGTKGGILAFLANGTVMINGSVSADFAGFRGGPSGSSIGPGVPQTPGTQGEGTPGIGSAVYDTANGNGGGGGQGNDFSNQGADGGGGGGNGTAGTHGGIEVTSHAGPGGSVVGTTDLTMMDIGGGGGGGGTDQPTGRGNTGGSGGRGGGILFIASVSFTVSGNVSARGQNGGNASGPDNNAGGGGGAGGSILIRTQAFSNLGSITYAGGTGGSGTDSGNINAGGLGGDGRILIS